jgi:hypothetical protein
MEGSRMTWISESDPVCWYKVTDKCDTRNKAKLLAMGEGLEDSEYIDLRVRKVYGRVGADLGFFGDEESCLELCDKDDDGAFPVWEVRDTSQKWGLGYA